MNVKETLEMMGERLAIAMVVCGAPDDEGNLNILYANPPASMIFGYPDSRQLHGLDVRKLMPQDHADRHRGYVKSGRRSPSGIMGQWRDLVGVRRDGSPIQIQANVAEIRDDDEHFLVAIFRDRTGDSERESRLQSALDESSRLKELAESARAEAESAREEAQGALLKERRLTGQISLLKQIYTGTIGLIVMMGMLIVASWVTGHGEKNKDALAMIERVLLVLTGILGSAMASVFDTRGRRDDEG
jgi:PAS domain S-box-containing protein